MNAGSKSEPLYPIGRTDGLFSLPPAGYQSQAYAVAAQPLISSIPSQITKPPVSPFVYEGHDTYAGTQRGHDTIFPAATRRSATPGMLPYPPLPKGPPEMELPVIPRPEPAGARISPKAPYTPTPSSFHPTSGGPRPAPYANPNLLAPKSGPRLLSKCALPRRSSSPLPDTNGAPTSPTGPPTSRTGFASHRG